MSRTPKQIYQTSKLIHWVLLIPMLFFSLFAFINNHSENRIEKTDLEVVIYIPMIASVIAITAGRFLYKNTIAKANGKPFQERMQTFMVSIIVRDALFEVAGISAAVAGFITGNNLILILVLLIAIQFFQNRPTLLKIENDLEATRDEMELLRA